MKLDEFTEALNEALILRGVPERIASLNVEKISAYLNDNRFHAMNADSSKEELNRMADELSERLLRHLQTNRGRAAADRTEPERDLESLNHAVSRAVGGNADHIAGGNADDDIEFSASPRSGAAFNADGDIELSASPCSGAAFNADDDIELSASPRAGATFNADGDIELSASPHSGAAFNTDGDIELSASPRAGAAFNADGDIELSASPRSGAAFNADGDIELSASPRSGAAFTADGADVDTSSVTADSTLAFSLPDDGLGAYAPDATMLTSMGLTKTNYEAEAIETRASKDGGALTLPPIPEIRETAQGRKKFKRTLICLSPLIAIAALAYFAAWGFVFAAEVALIAALIASLVAVAAAGTLAAITGIIYGIVRLSTRHGEGIFEIGLGIVIAGATLLAGVLIYNAALRFMPWAIKKTAYLCRLCSRLIHIRIRQARGRFSEK